MDHLFRCADVEEAIAMYQSLPFLPFPEAHFYGHAKVLRSNQLPLVAAVALDNPYPAAQFDEDPWNQMILKCLFVSLPLKRVYGLEAGCNPRLSTMLIDYAKERRAASRPIPGDLWRVATPQADAEQLAVVAATFSDHASPSAVRPPWPWLYAERSPTEVGDYLKSSQCGGNATPSRWDNLINTRRWMIFDPSRAEGCLYG